MRILVVGCGSIGRRHIRLLREMGVEVYGADPTPGTWRPAIDAGAADCFNGIDGLNLGLYDGAIVATPPSAHHGPAAHCLNAGVPTLIEKPISTAERTTRLVMATAEVRNVPILVGYNLRYHPGLLRVKELIDQGAIGTVRHARIWCGSYLPDWRPGTDYRQGYAARRETGGGVLLDISHELDYACWLLGEPVSVSCTAVHSGALELAPDVEDVADVTIRFASGATAAVHLDYLNHHYERGGQIVGDTATLQWTVRPPQTFRLWTDPHGDLQVDQWIDQIGFADDDMYRAELCHFLAVLRGEEQPRVTGEDGLRALRVALAARESSDTGRVVRL